LALEDYLVKELAGEKCSVRLSVHLFSVPAYYGFMYSLNANTMLPFAEPVSEFSILFNGPCFGHAGDLPDSLLSAIPVEGSPRQPAQLPAVRRAHQLINHHATVGSAPYLLVLY
jgi:hypothetical protein